MPKTCHFWVFFEYGQNFEYSYLLKKCQISKFDSRFVLRYSKSQTMSIFSPQFYLEIRKLAKSGSSGGFNIIPYRVSNCQFLISALWLRRLQRLRHPMASGKRAYGGRRCPEPNYCTEKEILLYRKRMFIDMKENNGIKTFIE